jgi:hypothetical protein
MAGQWLPQLVSDLGAGGVQTRRIGENNVAKGSGCFKSAVGVGLGLVLGALAGVVAGLAVGLGISLLLGVL